MQKTTGAVAFVFSVLAALVGPYFQSSNFGGIN
jgi:hypothetical protein